MIVYKIYIIFGTKFIIIYLAKGKKRLFFSTSIF